MSVFDVGRRFCRSLKTMITVPRGDLRVRINIVWALARMMQDEKTSSEAGAVVKIAFEDYVPAIRQAACRSFGFSAAKVDPDPLIVLLDDPDPGVRRETAATLGRVRDVRGVKALTLALGREMDRSEEHALIYALIEIDQPGAVQTAAVALQSRKRTTENANRMRRAMIALDQMSVDT